MRGFTSNLIMKNYCWRAAKVHPYSKTGGFGDMVGAFGQRRWRGTPRADSSGQLVTPVSYAGIRERFPQLKPLGLPLDLPLGAQRVRAETWSLEPIEGLTVYFVDQPAL